MYSSHEHSLAGLVLLLPVRARCPPDRAGLPQPAPRPLRQLRYGWCMAILLLSDRAVSLVQLTTSGGTIGRGCATVFRAAALALPANWKPVFPSSRSVCVLIIQYVNYLSVSLSFSFAAHISSHASVWPPMNRAAQHTAAQLLRPCLHGLVRHHEYIPLLGYYFSNIIALLRLCS